MKLVRTLILAIILLFHSPSLYAVLKGENINETIIMLKSELEVFSKYVNTTIGDFTKARSDYKNKMQEFYKELASTKLSLYSQQEQYIFGNAYASENAQKICNDFYSEKFPIKQWDITYRHAISRCEQLNTTLRQINPNILNGNAKASRDEGLKYLDIVLSDLRQWHDSIAIDLQIYYSIVKEVNSLQKEVDENYNYILNSLLLLPDKQPTHKVFSTNFPSHWKACVSTLTNMTATSHYYGWEFQDKWTAQARLIIFSGLIALIIGFFIGAFFISRWIPKEWDLVHKHSYIFNFFCGCIVVAATYIIYRIAFTDNPFFASALNLLIELCILCISLIYSVLLRVKNEQLISTILSYAPTTLLSFIIILYRITLVDINVIRVTYPIILLLFIIAQLVIIIYSNRKILLLDRYVSWTAIILFTLCFSLNFLGYYYLSIHIALAWSLYIIGLLVLSCYYYYLDKRKKYFIKKDETAFLKSWRAFTFPHLFKPMALIIVFVLCTLECARVFNINEWLNEFYNFKFINYSGIVCLSIKRIFHIIIFTILTNYFVEFVNFILKVNYKEKAEVGAMNLSRKVFSIVVWGAFIVIALAYIEVNSIGIIATLGGLAVGLGVALRDTFDCLLCGIMLMMGRIKIGDIVEVGNDIRGKVVDIQYRATLIETDDGAIISVFNTQFFGKDFRNVSYSGKYQRLHISFKVQKEIDSPKVRKMLAQALIDNVPELAKHPAPKILFGASDRFHVDMIAQVWVPVMDYYEAISNVKEVLFNTLKKNGMSNMSVDSRVRLIKNIVETENSGNDKKD